MQNLATTLEILCIGNELLIGKVVNTNASWMSKRATSLGVAVRRVTVGPDEVPEIAKLIREALSREPAFIITSGGLGPTFDDKTLTGLSEAVNQKLAVNPEALKMVKAKYEEYSKTRMIPEGEMTPPRVKMATFPEKAVPIINPVGTAPGVRLDIGNTIIIALPCVPKEMEEIFEASVVPLLRRSAGDAGFFELSIFADNIMESVLAPLIDEVMHDNPEIYIKSHPKGRENKPHMELHLSTSGRISDNPERRLSKASLQLSALIEKSGGEVVRAETQIE
jgi:molybdenum cofactor synthesis domain-containing protein